MASACDMPPSRLLSWREPKNTRGPAPPLRRAPALPCLSSPFPAQSRPGPAGGAPDHRACRGASASWPSWSRSCRPRTSCFGPGTCRRHSAVQSTEYSTQLPPSTRRQTVFLPPLPRRTRGLAAHGHLIRPVVIGELERVCVADGASGGQARPGQVSIRPRYLHDILFLSPCPALSAPPPSPSQAATHPVARPIARSAPLRFPCLDHGDARGPLGKGVAWRLAKEGGKRRTEGGEV